MSVPFKFSVGHTVVLTDDYGRESKFLVREIRSDGWMFEPYTSRGSSRETSGERKYVSGDFVLRHYQKGRFRYECWDENVIPAALERRLKLEFSEQPLAAQLKALRRRRIVLACEKAVKSGQTREVAYVTIPAKVIEEEGGEWLAEDTHREREKFDERVRKARTKPGEIFKAPSRFKVPCKRTVWTWTKSFVVGSRFVNALLDNHKGKNIGKSYLTADQDRELESYFSAHVRSVGGFDATAGWKELDRTLKRKGIKPISRRTFNRRLARRFNEVQLRKARLGAKATRRAGKISDAGPVPDWPLQQVEIDHVLLGVNCIDDATGMNFGLVWLSVCRDRLTGTPTGLHMSSLSPSWGTASRAMAHSMWLKDLSEFPELANAWLAHGIFDELYTDRGMEFLSEAGRIAAAQMKFDMLALPGFAPFLKGGIENWNKQVNLQVLSYQDGINAVNDPLLRQNQYPSMKRSVLRRSLIEWLVDEHLVSGSAGLTNGVSHNEAWLFGLEQHGPPRPIEDMVRFRRMTMVPDWRSIQDSKGVEVDGYFFKDLEGRLAQLKKDHPAPKYQIMIDPWDMGYIELLAGGEWHLLLNTEPSLSGITRYRSEFYWEEAKQRAPSNQRLSIDDLLRAKDYVDDDADRVLALGKSINRHGGSQNSLGRFLELGEFFTPVPLRDLRYEPLPVEVEGWTSDGGILRPTRVPCGLPGHGSQTHGQKECWEDDDPAIEEAASANDEDLFRNIASAGRARAREMNA